jgi:hypothetical protein
MANKHRLTHRHRLTKQTTETLHYHECPNGHQAILMVDPNDPRIIYEDQNGNIQYYCTACGSHFSVDQQGQIL